MKPSLSQSIQMHELHAPNARFNEIKTAICKLRRVRNYLPSTLLQIISIDISPSLYHSNMRIGANAVKFLS